MKSAVLSDCRVAYMLSPSTQREIQLFHYCQANIKQETTMITVRGVIVITEAHNLRTSLPSCPHPGWNGQ